MPEGYSTVADDCDDSPSTGALANPGAVEVCDGVNNDCDDQTDEGFPLKDFYPDQDGDGVGAGVASKACGLPPAHATRAGDCDDGDPERSPGRFEKTDGKDPVQPNGMADVASVFVAVAQTFAVRRDGAVWAWGSNEGGMIGDGTGMNHLVPVQVPALDYPLGN